MKQFYWVLLIILLPWGGVYSVRAQTEFFHELELEHGLVESEDWRVEVAGSWKHIYNEVGWRRLGLDPSVSRIAGNWTFTSGVATFYTFDREIENFGELRPWLRLGFLFDLWKAVVVQQFIRSEWRIFLRGSENYHRFRYVLNLGFALWKSERWSQVLGFESYFLDAPAIFERFPAERDYRLIFRYAISESQQFSLGLKYETFLDAALTEQDRGVLLILGYSF